MPGSCSPREFCPLFTGLSDEDYIYALRFFSAEEKKIAKGEILKLPGDSLGFFAFVISGTVQVYMDDVNGNRMIMNTVGPGKMFGESLCYIGRKSYAYIQATSDTVLLKMNAVRVCSFSASNEIFSSAGYEMKTAPENRARSSKISSFCSFDPRDVLLSGRFTAVLAARTLAMNRRIQILSKLTIREKLLTFLSQECAVSGKNTVEITMNREDMAAYLGTNVSALSRELGNMKREGLIDFRKNRFQVLK
ncbi:MAG: Crp/Fnr family transcriptional regulator [Eubacteriales bacterium]|nr:Crp/Fnr family transcriptional regulator [Eubacteriales bacterium]